jgi:4'-phosphopantetheinyl transferase
MIAYLPPMVDRALLDRVHVFTVQLDRPDVLRHLDGLRALLDEDERGREQRLIRPGDRALFVAAHALVRQQLSRVVSFDPRDWRFVANGHGRPEIANLPPHAPRIRFNLSHTAGLAACAITGDREVGVDVEHLGRALTHDVAARFFAPREVADLEKLPPGDRGRVFFDYWTLKEAYIKARGLGLALPLRHFAFVLRPPAPPRVTFDDAIDDEPGSWQFVQASPTPAHRLALAVRRTGADLPVTIEDVVPRPPA